MTFKLKKYGLDANTNLDAENSSRWHDISDL